MATRAERSERQRARRLNRQAERCCSATFCEGFIKERLPCGHHACETCYLHGLCYVLRKDYNTCFEHKCFMCRRVSTIDPQCLIDRAARAAAADDAPITMPIKGHVDVEAFLVSLSERYIAVVEQPKKAL